MTTDTTFLLDGEITRLSDLIEANADEGAEALFELTRTVVAVINGAVPSATIGGGAGASFEVRLTPTTCSTSWTSTRSRPATLPALAEGGQTADIQHHHHHQEPDMTANINTAAAAIGATFTPNGWCYYADETASRWLVSDEDMEALGALLNEGVVATSDDWDARWCRRSFRAARGSQGDVYDSAAEFIDMCAACYDTQPTGAQMNVDHAQAIVRRPTLSEVYSVWCASTASTEVEFLVGDEDGGPWDTDDAPVMDWLAMEYAEDAIDAWVIARIHGRWSDYFCDGDEGDEYAHGSQDPDATVTVYVSWLGDGWDVEAGHPSK